MQTIAGIQGKSCENVEPNQHFVYSTVSAQLFRCDMVFPPIHMWSLLKDAGYEAVTVG